MCCRIRSYGSPYREHSVLHLGNGDEDGLSGAVPPNELRLHCPVRGAGATAVCDGQDFAVSLNVCLHFRSLPVVVVDEVN